MKRHLLLVLIALTTSSIFSMNPKMDIITADGQYLPAELEEDHLPKFHMDKRFKETALNGKPLELPLTVKEWYLIKEYFQAAATKPPHQTGQYISPAAQLMNTHYKQGYLGLKEIEQIKKISQGTLFKANTLAEDIAMLEGSLNPQ